MATTFHDLVSGLWCLHWPGTRLPEPAVTALRPTGVFLDTCLRQLAFGLAPRPAFAAASGGQLSTGPAAYRLLIEVASGLHSAVPGETNVSGQFRRAAARAASELAPEVWRPLQPLVRAIEADTRALRATHLQGLPGNSYGSLVRALLAPRRDARVLFVGTGELARSMLPLFRAWETGAWNHRAGTPISPVTRWFGPDDAGAAARWATDVVLTTPADPEHDSAWQEHLRFRALRGLVHLGQRRGSDLLWPSAAASFDLDDVFELASARDRHRSRQLREAALACAALLEARLGDSRPVRVPAGLALAPA